MTSPEKRADIEAQLRRKYMRMKTINNHEDAKLKDRITELDRDVIVNLENHLAVNENLSHLQNNFTTTTGWYDGAIKPRKKDLKSSLMVDFKMKTKPWAYCSKDTIEMWEKHPPMRHIRLKRRPHTALPVKKSSDEAEVQGNKRPQTAVMFPDENCQDTESYKKDEYLLSCLRARLGRPMINNFHSPRLDDKNVKCGVLQRPVTAGVQSHERDESLARLAPKSARLPSRLNSENHSDSVFVDQVDGVGGKHVTKVEIKKKSVSSMSELKSSDSHNRILSTSSVKNTTRPSMSESNALKSKSDISANKEKTKEKSPDDKNESAHKKQHLPKWKVPKFYVKPQDRYKAEDVFLMRRHTLLQRQLASDMDTKVADDSVKVNIAFSGMARKNRLQLLIDENAAKMKRDNKKSYRETKLSSRIHQFLNDLDSFIGKQKEDDLTVPTAKLVV